MKWPLVCAACILAYFGVVVIAARMFRRSERTFVDRALLLNSDELGDDNLARLVEQWSEK